MIDCAMQEPNGSPLCPPCLSKVLFVTTDMLQPTSCMEIVVETIIIIDQDDNNIIDLL